MLYVFPRKISFYFFFITGVWCFGFFLDFLLPLKISQDTLHPNAPYRVSKRDVMMGYLVFTENKMPVEASILNDVKSGDKVKVYRTFFYGIIYKASYEKDDQVIIVDPAVGLYKQYIFFPLILLIITILGFAFENDREVIRKLLVANIILVFLTWAVNAYYYGL